MNLPLWFVRLDLSGIKKMPWNVDKSLWIGFHCTRGFIAVPANSMTAGSEFYVFLPRQGRLAKLNREMVRASVLEKKISPSDIDRITFGYNSCVAYKKYLDRKDGSIEEAHRLFLKYLGIDFVGIRKRPNYLPERKPGCYHCKKQLSSSIDLECMACGWILCQCGACGCGVHKFSSFSRSGVVRFDISLDADSDSDESAIPW